jgi:L-serine dehydratase
MASGVFDMIGPIMIGPSSSHTAGVAKIGLLAHNLWGQPPENVAITFYNSFANTYKGHGSDKAILGGLLGMKTDNPLLKTSLEIAQERGMYYSFSLIPNATQYHPNTIQIYMEKGDRKMTVLGESLGGGVINISSIDGFKAGFNGDLTTLMISADDKPGVIAFVSDILAHDGCNIATMTVSRLQRNGHARHFIEVDSAPKPLTLRYLESLPWIIGLHIILPIA